MRPREPEVAPEHGGDEPVRAALDAVATLVHDALGVTVVIRAVTGEGRSGRFRRGRAAATAALRAAGHAARPNELRFPSPTVSITHEDDTSFAVAVAPEEDDVQGVGIDVAAWRRALPPAAGRFFLGEGEHPAPDEHPRTLLELWTVKEAVFKADPANAGRRLRDYRITCPSAGRGATPTGRTVRFVTAPSPLGPLSVAVCSAGRWP